MSLNLYRKKRKFSGKNKTTEPPARINSKKSPDKKKISPKHKFKGRLSEGNRKRPRFVIHKHHAKHLHWDLRLEMSGVLKSWAVPKEPPRTKSVRRLAIQVEDHPIEYAKFKGVIPEGHYGAGKVKIWDSGKYTLLERSPKKIMFNLEGKRLKGNYVLIKISYGPKPRNWLWFKVK